MKKKSNLSRRSCTRIWAAGLRDSKGTAVCSGNPQRWRLTASGGEMEHLTQTPGPSGAPSSCQMSQPLECFP